MNNLLLDNDAHYAYNVNVRLYLMRFREIEKLLLANGWVFKNAKGSHCHYIHPEKTGKVTVPNHPGDISPIVAKAILKQAGL